MIKLSPNERLLVESGVNRYKLVGPGLIWLAPWHKALTKLYIGPNEEAYQLDEVRTVEHVPINVDLRVLYKVDLALLTPKLFPQVPWLGDGVWQKILRWRTEYILRQMMADYPWRELGKQPVQQRLERQLAQTLADQVKLVGLRLLSISLVKTELPADLQRTILQAERDSIEPRGRALVLKEYFDIFGDDLAQAMPHIVQWEVVNTLRKNGRINLVLAAASLPIDGPSPKGEMPQPLFQMQLPLPKE